MPPFNWPGPLFLIFYVALSIGVLVLARISTRNAERGNRPRLHFDDPYLIAYLRAGPNEALRVAAVSLIDTDRGLLQVQSETALASSPGTEPDVARRPLERALLQHFRSAKESTSLFEPGVADAALTEYQHELQARGMLPDVVQNEARRRRCFIAIALLGGIALVKLPVAFASGHSNVGFLVLLALLVCACTWPATHPRRTPVGDAVMDELYGLFARLKARRHMVRPGGTSTEAALLAAVFGLTFLPQTGFAYVEQIYPKAGKGDGSGGCGSADSSGCGGGSGGCGGCGG